MNATTISSKGQVVLPKKIRNALELKPGDKIDFQVESSDRVVLRPMRKSLADLKGFLPTPEKAVSLEEMEETIARSGAAP